LNLLFSAADVKEMQELLKVSNSSKVPLVIDLNTGFMDCILCSKSFDSSVNGNHITSTCQSCLDTGFSTDEDEQSPQKKSKGQILLFLTSLPHTLLLHEVFHSYSTILSFFFLPILVFLTYSLTHSCLNAFNAIHIFSLSPLPHFL
jgi:hypothetical protein